MRPHDEEQERYEAKVHHADVSDVAGGRSATTSFPSNVIPSAAAAAAATYIAHVGVVDLGLVPFLLLVARSHPR
jgi:hypothetical protein